MRPGHFLCSGVVVLVVAVLYSLGAGWAGRDSFKLVSKILPPPSNSVLMSVLDTPIDISKIDTMLSKNNYIMLSSVILKFEDQVEWNLTALSKDWALCMSQYDRVPTMSKVGIMSSIRFQRILSPWIPTKLGSYFRLMMHTSSIVYNHGPQRRYCGISYDNFYALRSHAGTNVLIGLEDLLRPAELAKATLDKLKAIFLLLFGTVLAVLYNEWLEDDMADMVCSIRNITGILIADSLNSYLLMAVPSGFLQKSSPNFKNN